MIEIFVIGLIAILLIISIPLIFRARTIMKTDELAGKSLMGVALLIFMLAAIILAVALFIKYLI